VVAKVPERVIWLAGLLQIHQEVGQDSDKGYSSSLQLHGHRGILRTVVTIGTELAPSV
jgi:hypothetical protein